MRTSTDERVRRLFVEAHTDRAPSFDEVLSRPRAEPSLGTRPWWPLAAAAALVVVFALPWLHTGGVTPDDEAVEFARQLARWRAPSDVLLEPYLKNEVLPGLGIASVVNESDRMVRWRR